MGRRIERVNSLLRDEVSQLVHHSLKDPRLASLVSITRVAATSDLALAQVYVSVLGSDEEKEATLRALASAAPYLRRELRARLTIRRLPELSFHLDESIEQSSRLLALMNQLSRERGEQSE